MPLLVNLKELEHRDGRLSGELPVEDLDLAIQDDAIQPTKTLTYDLNVQLMPDALFVRGKVGMSLDCRCVRCLEPFIHRVEFPDWICHVPLLGVEKAPIIKGFVDLTPYLREDILLAFPQHPLCRKDCPGLAAGDSEPPKNGDHGESSSPWDKLNQLKL